MVGQTTDVKAAMQASLVVNSTAGSIETNTCTCQQ